MEQLFIRYREADRNNWSKIANMSISGLLLIVFLLFYFKARNLSNLSGLSSQATAISGMKSMYTYYIILMVLVVVGLLFTLFDFFAYKKEMKWFAKISALTSNGLILIGLLTLMKFMGFIKKVAKDANSISTSEALKFYSDVTSGSFEFGVKILVLGITFAVAAVAFWGLYLAIKKIYTFDGVVDATQYLAEKNNAAATAFNQPMGMGTPVSHDMQAANNSTFNQQTVPTPTSTPQAATNTDATPGAVTPGVSGSTQPQQVPAYGAAMPAAAGTAAAVKQPIDWQKLRIPIIIAAVALVAVIGFFVWNTFFNFKTIDVFENVTVEYSGVSGKATARFKRGSANIEDETAKNFLRTVSYSFDKSTNLSEGDTIKLKANYSEDALKENKLKIKETEKEFKVEKLDSVPQAITDIPNYQEKVEEIRSKVKSQYTSNSTFTYTVKEESVIYGDATQKKSNTGYNELDNGTIGIICKVEYKIGKSKNTYSFYVVYCHTNIVKNGTTGEIKDGKFLYKRYLTSSYKDAASVLKDCEENGNLKKVDASGGGTA